ncbi:Hypothetical protein A7982_06649 [Minicystis rosea]|nr:Hypothetical protein A7982_06649 [Minicystis rosea]
MPSFLLGLVWRNADGSCLEEPWQFFGRESLPAALAAARRDGLAGELGRTFLGVVTVADENDPAIDHTPWSARRIDPTQAPSLAELDAKLAAAGIDLAAWQEPARTGPSCDAIEHVRWWELECAFGTGTLVAVLLRRCLAEDPEVAADSAELVGECIAHQTTIYSATPSAVAAIADLLPRLSQAPRETLAAWLEVVAESSVDDLRGKTESALRATLARTLRKGGTPDWMIDGLIERGVRHAVAAAACRDVFRAHADTFTKLGKAGLVGPKTKKLVKAVSK